jgi:hypothetical protein
MKEWRCTYFHAFLIRQQMPLLLLFREKRTRHVVRRLGGSRLRLDALEKKGLKSSAEDDLVTSLDN